MTEAGARTESSNGKSMATTVVPWLFFAPFECSRVVMCNDAKGGNVLNPSLTGPKDRAGFISERLSPKSWNNWMSSCPETRFWRVSLVER